MPFASSQRPTHSLLVIMRTRGMMRMRSRLRMRRWQSEKKSNMREEQLVGKCNLQKQINQGDSEDCQQTKASNASRLFNFLLPKIILLQILQIKGVRKRFNGVMSKSLKVPFLNNTPIHLYHNQISTSVTQTHCILN